MFSLLLGIYLLNLGIRYRLRQLNNRCLRQHGRRVPPGFEAVIDAGRLAVSVDYSLARSRLALAESLLGQLLAVLLFFCGGLGLYDRWLSGFGLPYLVHGLVFFAGLGLLQGLLSLPFDYRRQFGLEQRFGFNTMTRRLWLADQGKSLLLSLLLGGAILAAGLGLIRFAPESWWLWLWLLLAGVSLLLIYLLPVVIEPLFFTFAPVTRDGLADAIRRQMEAAGLPVSQVLQVDASRRSRHSNAYFTGIGRVKRIVLFDTLLEQLSDAEILAVLAHEAGHWRLGHVRRRLLGSQLLMLAAALGAFWLFRLESFSGWFGYAQLSPFARLLLIGFTASLVGFWLAPLRNGLSRRDERQADRFAANLHGAPADLATAMIKLARDNLVNLHPHPWYVWFHFSHPPVTARVAHLRQLAERP